MNLPKSFPRKARGKKGAALVEYAILVGLVSVTAIGSVVNLGGQIQDTYDTVTEVLIDPDSPVDEPIVGDPVGPGDPVVPGDPDRPDDPFTPTSSDSCQVIPDDGDVYSSSEYPEAECFTLTQGTGWGSSSFDYDGDDAQPFYISGRPEEGDAYLTGGTGNNIFVVEDAITSAVLAPNEGWNRLYLPEVSSDQVGWDWVNQKISLFIIGDLFLRINGCDVDEIIFTDTTMLKADYEAAGGFDCSSTDPDPDEGGGGGGGLFPDIGGGDETPFVPTDFTSVTEDCVGDQDYNVIWCISSNELPPEGVIMVPYMGDNFRYYNKWCAFDDWQGAHILETYFDGTRQMTCDMSEGGGYPGPTDGVCYLNDDYFPATPGDGDCYPDQVQYDSGNRVVGSGTATAIYRGQPLP